jgi:hypothetical protein
MSRLGHSRARNFDLRKIGPFKGRGALLEAAKAELLPAWERGSSADVAEAMAKFRDAHESELIAHAPVDRGNTAAFREWGGSISAWLYGTDHIKIAYGVQYEDVDIEQLSPGRAALCCCCFIWRLIATTIAP